MTPRLAATLLFLFFLSASRAEQRLFAGVTNQYYSGGSFAGAGSIIWTCAMTPDSCAYLEQPMPFPPGLIPDTDKATPTALVWVAEESRVWMAVKLGPSCVTGKYDVNECPPAQLWNCDATRRNACELLVSYPWQKSLDVQDGKNVQAYPMGMGILTAPAALAGGSHVWVSLGNGTMTRCQATGGHACSWAWDAGLPIYRNGVYNPVTPVMGQFVVAASLGAVFQLNSDATVSRCATSDDGAAACAQAYAPVSPSWGCSLGWDEKGRSLLIAAIDNVDDDPASRQTLRACYLGKPPCTLLGSWGVGELGGVTSVQGMQPATTAIPYPLPYINSIVSDGAGTVIFAAEQNLFRCTVAVDTAGGQGVYTCDTAAAPFATAAALISPPGHSLAELEPGTSIGLSTLTAGPAGSFYAGVGATGKLWLCSFATPNSCTTLDSAAGQVPASAAPAALDRALDRVHDRVHDWAQDRARDTAHDRAHDGAEGVQLLRQQQRLPRMRGRVAKMATNYIYASLLYVENMT